MSPLGKSSGSAVSVTPLGKIGYLCAVGGVFLFPLVAGLTFVRLLFLAGTPLWWLIFHGAVVLFAIAQAVFFLIFGLTSALKHAIRRLEDGSALRPVRRGRRGKRVL